MGRSSLGGSRYLVARVVVTTDAGRLHTEELSMEPLPVSVEGSVQLVRQRGDVLQSLLEVTVRDGAGSRRKTRQNHRSGVVVSLFLIARRCAE